MPILNYSVSLEEAFKLVSSIVEKAKEDGGLPVAVAIANASGRLIAFAAMDGVIPACIKLSQSKAYSAVMGNKDTKFWAALAEKQTYDMANWTDENFSGFTGGIIIEYEGKVIGGIGVSGRKGCMASTDTSWQDEELATFGKSLLILEDI
jgi:uncharacterized protein GlcG (DUF336 family)